MVLVPCSGMVLVQKFWNDPDPLSLVVVYIFLTGPGHLFWNGSGPSVLEWFWSICSGMVVVHLFWNGCGPSVINHLFWNGPGLPSLECSWSLVLVHLVWTGPGPPSVDWDWST